jgi:hypothetical protein
MWRQDGLCEIQATLGERALCQVCGDFPRLRHDYGDFMELGLELSCPEAARLILNAPSPAMIHTTASGEEAAEYDADAMTLLRASRQQARAILDDPAMNPGQTLAVLLLFGYRIQALLDGEEAAPFDSAAALEEAGSLAQPGEIRDIFALYRTLEILTPQWRALLESDPAPQPWQESHRALARYFLDRYWLQAVSDYDLIGRVKFLITSCLMIRHLPGNTVQTAQLYSKEIENDADNVCALLDAAYTSPALTDVKLLGFLL